MNPRSVSAVGLGCFIWSMIVWGFITFMSVYEPPTQFMNFSIYIPIESDLLAEIAFMLGFVGFVVWQRYRG